MSRTGNTEKIAQAIFSAIPGKNKDIARFAGQTDYDMGDIYFIGFWTDRGSASVEVLDYLGSLQGKKIALFGTCGMGESIEYYRKIEERIKVFIEDGNQYLGCFLCQGKMPMQVRKRYEVMEENPEQREKAQMLIRNFDKALLHPDEEDVQNAVAFAREAWEKAESCTDM